MGEPLHSGSDIGHEDGRDIFSGGEAGGDGGGPLYNGSSTGHEDGRDTFSEREAGGDDGLDDDGWTTMDSPRNNHSSNVMEDDGGGGIGKSGCKCGKQTSRQTSSPDNHSSYAGGGELGWKSGTGDEIIHGDLGSSSGIGGVGPGENDGD